jgi:hypothetical protein
MFPIYFALIGSVVFIAVIPLAQGTELASWALSIYFYVSVWHVYRQDHGICKIYDLVQAQRFGDHGIARDRKWLNIFFAMASLIVIVHSFGEPILFHPLAWDRQEYFRFIHPYLSKNFFYVFVFTTLAIGIIAFKRAIWDRYRNHKIIPWPQLSLITISTLSYCIPFFVCRGTQVQLGFAYLVHEFFHNVQYWGVVWLTEGVRSAELANSSGISALAFPQRFALKGNWKGYFGASFCYAAGLLFLYKFSPQYIGLTVVFLVSFAHFIVDGYLWRRDSNKLLSVVLGKLAIS